MRILFVSNDPSIFRDTSEARSRMRAYAAFTDELHIVSPAGGGAQKQEDGNLFLYPVSAWKLFRVRALAKVARALVKERNIDVVSAQDPFEHGLAALKAVAGTRAKLHVQVHTDFLSLWFTKSGNWRSPTVSMPLLNRYRRLLADEVLTQADGIRVVSARIKRSLMERYGSRIKEPMVIPIAVNPETPAPARLPQHPFTFSLICVGRLEPEKRVEDILAALKLVVAHYPMVGLFIVGEGRERTRLVRMTQRLKLEAHVRFLGARDDARALLSSAQAFIQASAYEGYGRTLVEAALANVPIITTDVGIVGEVFKGYEDVLSVPVADPTALSLAIVGLVEDNAVRCELSLHAQAAVRAHLASVKEVPRRIMEDLARLV